MRGNNLSNETHLIGTMKINTVFLSVLLILLPLSGCLEEMSSRTEVAEDGTEQCWAILQTNTTMEHEEEWMREGHSSTTTFTYDENCNMVSSITWDGAGYGGFVNITYNDANQPVLMESTWGEWNTTTSTIEGDVYRVTTAYVYENGLLMQSHTYYEVGEDEYWNYTYDAQGREVLVESTYETTESFYDANGRLSTTKRSDPWGTVFLTNYTYDANGILIQEIEIRGDSDEWEDEPKYTNHTIVDGLRTSTTYSYYDGYFTYTYNDKGDLVSETDYWGSDYPDGTSSTVTNHWGYADLD
jgi:hypothetical protein